MENKIICGIYKITSPSGRVYIGQSKDIQKRWGKHYKKLRCKKQTVLYRSFLKYGVENHIFEIIEEANFGDLNCCERYWQDFYDVLNEGLNCELVNCDGIKKEVSEETIERKIKSSHKTKIGVYTLEGNLVEVYESVKEASRQLNIPDNDIHRACKQKGQRCGFLFSKTISDKIAPIEESKLQGKWNKKKYKVTFINGEIEVCNSRDELLKFIKINQTTLYKHLNKNTIIKKKFKIDTI
jgi:hypothetical protein